MSLSNHIKKEATGWNVRKLANRLGYSEYGFRNMCNNNPERLELWLKGLKSELQTETKTILPDSEQLVIYDK